MRSFLEVLGHRVDFAGPGDLPPLATWRVDANRVLSVNPVGDHAELAIGLRRDVARASPCCGIGRHHHDETKFARSACGVVVHRGHASGWIPDRSTPSSAVGVPNVSLLMDVRAFARELANACLSHSHDQHLLFQFDR